MPENLSQKEQLSILKKYRETGDEECRDVLLKQNMAMAHYIINNYYSMYNVPEADLAQEAYLAIMDAVDKFDFDKGSHFSNYVAWRVRSSLTSYVPKYYRAISVPCYIFNHLSKIEKVEYQFLAEFGREPTDDELLKYSGANEIALRYYKDQKEGNFSLDFSEEDDASSLHEKISDTKDSPDEIANTNEQTSLLVKIVKEELTEIERFVVTRQFGLLGLESFKINKIASELGCSVQWVHQISKKATLKIGKKMNKFR